MGPQAHLPQGDPLIPSGPSGPTGPTGPTVPTGPTGPEGGGQEGVDPDAMSAEGRASNADGESFASPPEEARVTPSPPGGSNEAMSDGLSDLVAEAKAGDPRAFEELVRRTHPGALTLAVRLMGNEEDALDVVQDAYIRAYKGLRRFRGDARFSTWLYRIVANCCATSLGKRSRHRHEELTDDAPFADDHPDRNPEVAAAGALERERVAAAVATLPERLRLVVVLRDVYDLTHEAIAAELGISETAAKVRLHRARKKLRARLYPLRDEADGDLDGLAQEDRDAS